MKFLLVIIGALFFNVLVSCASKPVSSQYLNSPLDEKQAKDSTENRESRRSAWIQESYDRIR
jgi:hypothetical protein